MRLSISSTKHTPEWTVLISGGHRIGTGTGPTTVRTITTAKSTTQSMAQPTMNLMPWKQATKPPAPGTVGNCTAWYNAWELKNAEDGSDMSSLNKCYIVASIKDIYMEELVAWNPSLETDWTCQLDPLYSYCVAGPSLITTVGSI